MSLASKTNKIATLPGRLAEIPYKLFQPLSYRAPGSNTGNVSDLFPWRADNGLETIFHLVNLRFLIEGTHTDAGARFVLFDESGDQVLDRFIPYTNVTNSLVSVTGMAPSLAGKFGVFAVFHVFSHCDLAITHGSTVSERGYVGYRYGGSQLIDYVHGNLDAIYRDRTGRFVMLGGKSWLPRLYSCQHVVQVDQTFEYFLVNPSDESQAFKVSASCIGGGEIMVSKFRLKPRGSRVIRYTNTSTEPRKIRINSRLVMSRPVVFEYDDSTADVFHG